jgi:hypothetical protein
MEVDQAAVTVGVKRFVIEQFDGEHVPGDGKRPIAILVGGDGLPTRRLTPMDPEFASHLTEGEADGPHQCRS